MKIKKSWYQRACTKNLGKTHADHARTRPLPPTLNAGPIKMQVNSVLLNKYVEDNYEFDLGTNHYNFKILRISADKLNPPMLTIAVEYVSESQFYGNFNLKVIVDQQNSRVKIWCEKCEPDAVCEHGIDFIKYLAETTKVRAPLGTTTVSSSLPPAKRRRTVKNVAQTITNTMPVSAVPKPVFMNPTSSHAVPVAMFYNSNIKSEPEPLKPTNSDNLQVIAENTVEYVSIAEIAKPNPTLLQRVPTESITGRDLTMIKLMQSFVGSTVEQFLEHCRQKMVGLCNAAESLTIEQADNSLWHGLRLGRVTASRIHQVRGKSRYCTVSKSIMGQSSGYTSHAMERGIVLEGRVFDIVRQDYPDLKKSGLMLNPKYPWLGASPDGVHAEFVLEIKCPLNYNTHVSYVTPGKLKKQYAAQIQMQMYMAGKQQALLAVADPNFGRNKRITKVWIPFDAEYTATLLQNGFEFWKSAVFPVLMERYQTK